MTIPGKDIESLHDLFGWLAKWWLIIGCAIALVVAYAAGSAWGIAALIPWAICQGAERRLTWLIAARSPVRRRVQMNGRNYRMTPVMRDVLAAIVDADTDDPQWGARLCDQTGYGSGTVYPALDRLMQARLISDEQEDPYMTPAGRAARRLYRPCYAPAWYRSNGLLYPVETAP